MVLEVVPVVALVDVAVFQVGVGPDDRHVGRRARPTADGHTRSRGEGVMFAGHFPSLHRLGGVARREGEVKLYQFPPGNSRRTHTHTHTLQSSPPNTIMKQLAPHRIGAKDSYMSMGSKSLLACCPSRTYLQCAVTTGHRWSTPTRSRHTAGTEVRRQNPAQGSPKLNERRRLARPRQGCGAR